MTRKVSKLQRVMLVLLAGGMPLVAVASCEGFGPGVVFVNGFGGGHYHSGGVVDVFVDDTVYFDDDDWDDDDWDDDDWDDWDDDDWYEDGYYCDPYFDDCW